MEAANIIPLVGEHANRATLARAVSAVIDRAACTDAVFLYVTAVSATTQGMSMLMTDGLYEDDWIAGLADRFPLMRAVTDAGPFLLLNPSGAGRRKSSRPARCRNW